MVLQEFIGSSSTYSVPMASSSRTLAAASALAFARASRRAAIFATVLSGG